jgi:hypothetical protein
MAGKNGHAPPLSLAERIARLERGHDTLVQALIDQMGEIRSLAALSDPARMRVLAEEAVGARREEIATLTDHCVRVLEVLIAAGLVDRAALNAAVAGGSK